MKRKYLNPELIVEFFDHYDIVARSGFGDNEGGGWGDGEGNDEGNDEGTSP